MPRRRTAGSGVVGAAFTPRRAPPGAQMRPQYRTIVGRPCGLRRAMNCPPAKTWPVLPFCLMPSSPVGGQLCCAIGAARRPEGQNPFPERKRSLLLELFFLLLGVAEHAFKRRPQPILKFAFQHCDLRISLLQCFTQSPKLLALL